jgi:hypothetical protein
MWYVVAASSLEAGLSGGGGDGGARLLFIGAREHMHCTSRVAATNFNRLLISKLSSDDVATQHRYGSI